MIHRSEVNRHNSSVLAGKCVCIAGLALSLVAGPALAGDRSWNSDWGDWSDASKWTPNNVPTPADRAIVGALVTDWSWANLDMNVTLAGLEVHGIAEVQTLGYRLDVNGEILLAGDGPAGASDYYARIDLSNGPAAVDLEADTLTIGDRGGIYFGGENANILVHGNMTLAPESILFGTGTVTVNGNVVNSGEIGPGSVGLIVNVPGGTIDLDGGGSGSVVINPVGDSFAAFNAAGISDSFDGYIFIGHNSTLTMNIAGGWETGPASILSATHWMSVGQQPLIQGTQMTLGGDLYMSGTYGRLRITAPTILAPTSGFVSGVGNELELVGVSTVQGGEFLLEEEALVTFAGSATVAGGDFDLGDGATVDFNGPTSVSGGQFTTFSNSLSGGSVNFSGPTTWHGAVTIDGVGRQIGAAVVSAATTITADVFDMDGSAGTAWTVNAPFAINAETIESAVGNTFDGTIEINGGFLASLSVNLAAPTAQWTVSDRMTLVGDTNLYVTRVAGSPLRIIGDLVIPSGRTQVMADTLLASSAGVRFGTANAAVRFRGETTIAPGVDFIGSGTLRNGVGGRMTLEDGLSLGSTQLINDADLRITSGAGAVSVDRFENGAAATLRVSIGGYTAESEYDVLSVTSGPAVLSGFLNVEVIDGPVGLFEPVVGDTFTVLTAAGGINGAFQADPVSCYAGHTYYWSLIYGANSVSVRLDEIDECCPPDIDGDGIVGLSDLAILLANYGTIGGATQPTGDVNFDGTIDLEDLSLLLAAFGTPCS